MRATQRVLDPTRIRIPEGSFAFVPHRFLRGGFWQACSPWELVAYFFLVLVSDRHGMSFYGREKTAVLCRMSRQRLEGVYTGLVEKDLIAGDGVLTQVLSLPQAPVGIGVERRRPEAHGPLSVAEALHAFRLDLERRNR